MHHHFHKPIGRHWLIISLAVVIIETLSLFSVVLAQTLLPSSPLTAAFVTRPSEAEIVHDTIELKAKTSGTAASLSFRIAHATNLEQTKTVTALYQGGSDEWSTGWSSRELVDGTYSVTAIATSSSSIVISSTPVLFTIKNNPQFSIQSSKTSLNGYGDEAIISPNSPYQIQTCNSSNTLIVTTTLSSSGCIARAVGTGTVTITARENGGQEAALSLQTLVPTFAFSRTSVTVAVGSSELMAPLETTILIASCTSSDTTIFTTQLVNNACQITGAAAGTATLKALSAYNAEATAQVTVEAPANTTAPTFSFTITQATLRTAGETVDIEAVSGFTISTCVSSQPQIVAVELYNNRCRISAVANGTALITGTSSQGATATASVEVVIATTTTPPTDNSGQRTSIPTTPTLTSVKIILPLNGAKISEPAHLQAETNAEADIVEFSLDLTTTNIVDYTLPATKAPSLPLMWGYALNHTKFTPGIYEITARAIKGNQTVESAKIRVEIFHRQTIANPPVVSMISPSDQAETQGTITLKAKATENTAGVNFTIRSHTGHEFVMIGLVDPRDNLWTVEWNTAKFANGEYFLVAQIPADIIYSSAPIRVIVKNDVSGKLFEQPAIVKNTPTTVPGTTEKKPPAPAPTVPVIPTTPLQPILRINEIAKTTAPVPGTPATVPAQPTRTEPTSTDPATRTPGATQPSSAAPATENTPPAAIILPGLSQTARITVAQACIERGITDTARCERYLATTYQIADCQRAGIVIQEECAAFLARNAKPTLPAPEAGAPAPQPQPQQSLESIALTGYVTKEQHDVIESSLREFVNKPLILGPETPMTPEPGEPAPAARSTLPESVRQEIPLSAHTPATVTVMASPATVVTSERVQVTSSPAIIVIDSDGDGLSDDMEARLGTNPQAADSDNDGRSDRDELKNKTNPLGVGPLNERLSPIDTAIINQKPIEQPKTSGKEEPEKLEIGNIENAVTAEQEPSAVVFKGKAEPNTIITLYIYSYVPMVVTVQTSAAGEWSYVLEQPLSDGAHEGYVVINDDTGKIVSKSRPYRFFVDEAQAVTEEEFFRADVNVSNPITTRIYLYIVLTIAAILAGAWLIYLFRPARQSSQV